MPLHYYHKKIIRLLGYVVGKIIKIDYNMELAIWGKFARIAVEVYFDRPLISQFLLNRKIQKVEYDSLPTICFWLWKVWSHEFFLPRKVEYWAPKMLMSKYQIQIKSPTTSYH